MDELKILQKTEDMIYYGNQALIQFPKTERFVLAAEIRQRMYNIYSLIITANKKYFKKTTLQDIDVELEVLRGLLRLAANKNLRYLPMNRYENWSKLLNEIGKMLGGWIKATKQQASQNA
jgi:hypothetical protein